MKAYLSQIPWLQYIYSLIAGTKEVFTAKPQLFFRMVLFITFLGHGLVSLGFSPGYELHYRIFESINFFNLNIHTFLYYQGFTDIMLATAILFGIFPRFFLSIAIVYLASVAVAGGMYFLDRTGSFFGIAESFRRFPWILYAVFLWVYYNRNQLNFSLLRMGLAFAFLSHGLASLGLFGLSGGHIELASQILSEETASNMVFYSGYSDTFFGILLLTGIFSRPVAIIGFFWLIVVVYLSWLVAFPDAIFRSGFLLSGLYVAIDKRCHTAIWKKTVVLART